MWFCQNLQRNLKLTAELLHILRMLNENHICTLPFKGPVLTASLYGNLALRQFVDLDLLVRRTDVLRAKTLLQGEGYESPFRLSERQEQAYLSSQCEHHLLAPGGLFQVELHWQALARFHGFSFDTEGWWRRRRHANLHKIEVPTLSLQDELLVLCVHGQKHCWSRLIWISDVAQLLTAHPDLAWDQVTQGAKELGAERVLRLGLHLAHNLLQAPLPEAILERIGADAAVQRLSSKVWRNLPLEEAWASDRKTILFALHARERLRDRARHLARRAITSTPLDWSLVRLPDAVFSLYSLLRIVRLAGQAVKRLLLHLNGRWPGD